MAAPMPRVPPVTNATRAILVLLPDRFPTLPYVLDGPSHRQSARTKSPGPFSSSLSFEAHGDAHAAADAQGCEPLLRVPLLHLMQERHENPRPGGADRMTDGDGAAVHVDDRGVPRHVLVDR